MKTTTRFLILFAFVAVGFAETNEGKYIFDMDFGVLTILLNLVVL